MAATIQIDDMIGVVACHGEAAAAISCCCGFNLSVAIVFEVNLPLGRKGALLLYNENVLALKHGPSWPNKSLLHN